MHQPSAQTRPPDGEAAPAGHRILIVDDEPAVRNVCRHALKAEGLACEEAVNGAHALVALRAGRYDLVLLDVDMPVMNGLDLCRRLRAEPPAPHLKIIMFSGRVTGDELSQLMLNGADDYLTKPFSPTQLCARVHSALRLKDAQERSDRLNHDLLTLNHELERALRARDSDLVEARNALFLALAKLAESRDNETGAHLLRVQNYARCLAEEAARAPAHAGQVDDNFIEMLACCAPLHDIGKVGVPDHVLRKPGPLDAEERRVMRSHTTIGAETLRQVVRQHGFALAFLEMAADIARHHHERFDGQGYPDRLAGSDIPLAARLVALGDVYDALRSPRVYKPPLTHAEAVEIILGSPGHFDPGLLPVFQRCADKFEHIYDELTG